MMIEVRGAEKTIEALFSRMLARVPPAGAWFTYPCFA